MGTEFTEFSAKTVDDAITKACIELGASSDSLEIQVVREGTSGFLGIGSKPAIIKVRKKSEETVSVEEDVKKPVEKAVEKTEKKVVKAEDTAVNAQEEAVVEKKQPDSKDEFASEKKVEKVEKKLDKKNRKNDFKAEKKGERKPRRERSQEERKTPERKEYVIVDRSEEEIEKINKDAVTFLSDVFKSMELPVEIKSEYDKESGTLNIDFEGEDMGILIGKRGQTLDSLQYLTSLVVNKSLEHYIRVKLDTENYRSRRKDTLENLAKNIAYKVRKTRKPVSLEPMNPYERRIIHSALQGNKYVETYSEGSEPYRHVVIAYKR